MSEVIPNQFTRANMQTLLNLCYLTAGDLVRFNLHRAYKPREGCETVLLFSQNPCPETRVVAVTPEETGYVIRVLCNRSELIRWLVYRLSAMKEGATE
jgi:hypothetical protein